MRRALTLPSSPATNRRTVSYQQNCLWMPSWNLKTKTTVKTRSSFRCIKTIGTHDKDNFKFSNPQLPQEYPTIIFDYMHQEKVDITLVYKGQERTYTVQPSVTAKQFYKSISKIFSIPKEQLAISYINSQIEGVRIDEDESKSLEELGVMKQCRVKVRDMGKQIRWDLVFYIEYLGPIVIIPLFYYFGKKEKYQLVHHMAAIMGVTHFVKRELESRFVHVFSRKTMPLKRVFINSAHYWILFGFLNSIQLFLFPKEMKWDSNQLVILFLIWAFMEFCNFKCHLELSSFRKDDKKNRGIPKNWGFKYVSCANYLWETLGWLTFSIMTKCYSSFVFTAVSAAQMASWALKKHQAYKKEFGAEYPKDRKAIFPFIL